MSPLREALLVPCLFLTVALLGGLRVGPEVRLVPPPLVALILAMLLLSAFVRSGVVVPERLMHQHRTPLENLSGLVVLLTLFAASAQMFNLVTPDDGLLHVLVSVFFFVQLLTTLTAVRDRLSMLRGLVVLLGCAFVLRFIALESLYSPGRGLLKRVMTAMLEGITLGGIEYAPAGAATGYVAFLALVLYVIGLIVVGSASAPRETSGVPAVRETPTSIVVPSVVFPLCLSVLSIAVASCGPVRGAVDNPADVAPTTKTEREAVLASARVWKAPAGPIPAARLGDNPSSPWSFRTTDEVSCRFVVAPVGGTTPKFNCELPSGEIVKVKYGERNPELFAEVAATRLLAALGFHTDQMYLVEKVRCFGCPSFPFQALRCHAGTALGKACFAGALDTTRSADFAPAVIEHRVDGRKIESADDRGWAWYELDRIDPARGGSPRGHVDALRLMAVILSHWDNKAENQRLVCRGTDGRCGDALAMVQDLGATFGPTKLDLHNWKNAAVWSDARECRVSMEHLPYDGATFSDAQISEDGRTLLLSLLEQLSAVQMRDLFTGSGMTRFDSISGEGRDADAWTRVFQDKIGELRDAGPCPAVVP